ncbi:MAG: EamA family transporter [Mucilaginibacter sp.]|uniref:EamA family transporter n=1 Tax=Mucilaginibacter sp. TaxID=1882438 RepID=UPI0032663CF6
MPSAQKTVSPLLVIIAFATVYIVWGSTYFFIQMGERGFPPMLLGAIRFFSAGLLLITWCAIKGEKLFVWQNVKHAAVSGILLLFVANGTVIWSEQTLPSAMVAIMVSAAPIWFVVLDKAKWAENFKSKSTIFGLLIGFAGVILLFGEQIMKSFNQTDGQSKLWGMLMLVVASIAWPSGSLYAKYKATEGSVMVNTAWQMIIAGLVFIPGVFIHNELPGMNWQAIPLNAWLALIYLILFGSIAAFSAYVWLLQVRPATQVSTYAYVNPVIAVILGIFFAHENISLLQIVGLIIILGSVLLINLAKYQKEGQAKPLTN